MDKWTRGEPDEEHITVFSKPGSEYGGHLTPRSGQGGKIEKSLYN